MTETGTSKEKWQQSRNAINFPIDSITCRDLSEQFEINSIFFSRSRKSREQEKTHFKFISFRGFPSNTAQSWIEQQFRLLNWEQINTQFAKLENLELMFKSCGKALRSPISCGGAHTNLTLSLNYLFSLRGSHMWFSLPIAWTPLSALKRAHV